MIMHIFPAFKTPRTALTRSTLLGSITPIGTWLVSHRARIERAKRFAALFNSLYVSFLSKDFTATRLGKMLATFSNRAGIEVSTSSIGNSTNVPDGWKHLARIACCSGGSFILLLLGSCTESLSNPGRAAMSPSNLYTSTMPIYKSLTVGLFVISNFKNLREIAVRNSP